MLPHFKNAVFKRQWPLPPVMIRLSEKVDKTKYAGTKVILKEMLLGTKFPMKSNTILLIEEGIRIRNKRKEKHAKVQNHKQNLHDSKYESIYTTPPHNILQHLG